MSDELANLLSTMDIPVLRREDLGWLSRNLGIRNQDHPNFAEAIALIQKLNAK